MELVKASSLNILIMQGRVVRLYIHNNWEGSPLVFVKNTNIVNFMLKFQMEMPDDQRVKSMMC